MAKTTKKGAAATGHRLTTQAALEIIDAGGNAFDGAIAAAFMACICEPVLASPGGGGFAMIHTGNNKSNNTTLLDFFAQTPQNKNNEPLDFLEIEADFGTSTQVFHIGQASSATPGFLPGLITLHEKFATMPMEQLIAPARNAALTGVTITPFQAYLSSVVAPILMHSQQSRAVFAPTGKLHQAGDIFKNRALAEFLDQFSASGISAFPKTSILQDQEKGGHLQLSDFDDYQVLERQPLTLEIAQSRLHFNPKPAAGGILIALALKQLIGFDSIHIAQALDFVDNFRSSSPGETGPPAHRGTTQISIIDANRNACSLTLSNGEGNGYMIDGCGFMLNNMLGEADINPGGKLGWPQNTRMSSMMCPTIVERKNGSLLALGSGGSNRIRSAIFQVLVNLLQRDLGIEESIIAARMHVENHHLDFETPTNNAIANQLKSAFRDHRQWPEKNMFFGGCHIASINTDNMFDGFGDPRRHGNFATI